MRLDAPQLKSLRYISAIFVLACGLCGCAAVGPRSIATGRGVYNEVINRTEDQQMLTALVRTRYGETVSMLAVASIVANVRVTAEAGVNVGVGRPPSYEQNLVPLSGGIAYEENPTISYAPVQGEDFVDRLTAPVPLYILVSFARSMESLESGKLIFLALTRSLNHLRNPHFLRPPSVAPDPQFSRVVDLLTELSVTGCLDWVKEDEEKFGVFIHDYAPERSEEVRELLALLRVPQEVEDSKPIVLPVSQAVVQPASGGIAVTTRSIFDLIAMLSAAIDVPEEHTRSGLAVRYPPRGLPAKGLRIYRSAERPSTASVAVSYRQSWFYIDETDQATKLMFRLLRALWEERIASQTKHDIAPLLTIPVGQ